MKANLMIGGVVLGVVAIVMGMTNPKPEAYTEYMSQKLLSEGGKVFCKETEVCHQNASGIVKNAVALFKGKVARPVIKTVIEESTHRQNLLLFSLYTTEVTDVGSIKTIGAFNHFFTYSKSSKLS